MKTTTISSLVPLPAPTFRFLCSSLHNEKYSKISCSLSKIEENLMNPCVHVAFLLLIPSSISTIKANPKH